MLRRTPSLALRAGLIFISIYMIVFSAVLTVAAFANSGEASTSYHDGPRMALSFAVEELQEAGGSYRFPSDGRFAQLAAKNPSLWLIGRGRGRSFTFGPVPRTASRFFQETQEIHEVGRFNVPGADPPLRVAMLRRYGVGRDAMVLAAGGVDPTTLTLRDSLLRFGPPVLVVLGVIAALGFVAMLISLPLLSRAIRPITAEAGALRPDDARRLDERKAPRELLPLVRVFNAVLDRLAAELGRRKRFIADVAHELRTPLAVVALRIESLEEQEAREDLRRSTSRLTHLVGQMLDLERLSLAGRTRVALDLSAVARDVIADLAPMAIRAGYDLSLEAPDPPVIIIADEHAVARAITNLIANSIAHGGGGGDIRISIGTARTLDVIDEGPGVPASLQSRLFEPFCRESTSSEGSGLGLHLTREIMRAHGGLVRLLPTERGATFRLEFAPPSDELLDRPGQEM